ncbi:hypothetical protein DAEQUDRAFT_241481 [Daedalea quercina L-15889]|uniref:Uncharacterized protein n=1 Tax=Daedalea quercina L-15889 TaxID=1314783 RepID=A0A165QR79_9APHY|nr:hypothetical protein DAEQUDRAFT_241481 [Daedalea quercina L-15889]
MKLATRSLLPRVFADGHCFPSICHEGQLSASSTLQLNTCGRALLFPAYAKGCVKSREQMSLFAFYVVHLFVVPSASLHQSDPICFFASNLRRTPPGYVLRKSNTSTGRGDLCKMRDGDTATQFHSYHISIKNFPLPWNYCIVAPPNPYPSFHIAVPSSHEGVTTILCYIWKITRVLKTSDAASRSFKRLQGGLAVYRSRLCGWYGWAFVHIAFDERRSSMLIVLYLSWLSANAVETRLSQLKLTANRDEGQFLPSTSRSRSEFHSKIYQAPGTIGGVDSPVMKIKIAEDSCIGK